ncbi:MAG TPA: diguanylate cyclase [Candidatus Saccharimonadia bacterium]
MTKLITSLYDPAKTYEDNFIQGPFGDPVEPYRNEGEPLYEAFGHKLYSPFGIPAGPLLNSNYVKDAFERGFDAVVYKTQRSVPFAVNTFPQILYVDVDGDLTPEKAAKPLLGQTSTSRPVEEFSITNSFGMPSKGPDYWVEDMKKALSYQGKGQLMIMGIVGTIQKGFSQEDYLKDFAYTAGLAVDGGAKVIEANLSCPNVATEGILCYSPDSVIDIVQGVKERIGNTPLIIKIGDYAPEQQELLEQIVQEAVPYIAGISSINTIPAPIVDENGNQALPGPNRLKSGVCGASIKWAGLDMSRKLKAIREKYAMEYKIIGVGGVMSAADFQEYRDAGADIVQSATGAMWNPSLAAEVKATLSRQ